MKRTNWMLWATCVPLLLVGCASHEALPPSGQRQPTSPQAVKVYQKHPKRYERLGQVKLPVTPAMKWDERGDATAGFEALMAKAAAVGANGLLLVSESAADSYLVTAGYGGTFYRVPMQVEPRAALAEAIFVLEE